VLRFAVLLVGLRPAPVGVLVGLVPLEPDEADPGGGFSEPARDRAAAGERVGMAAR